MKNFSKKKFPGRKRKQDKNSNESNFYSKNKNRSEKDEKFLNNSAKNKNFENLIRKDNNNNFSTSRRRKPVYKSNTEFPNKNPEIHQQFSNNKNFDDWIWGKHSVYETLTSE